MAVTPCLCCGQIDAVRGRAADGENFGYNLFQPGRTRPCAWAHQSCFAERVAKHARHTPEGVEIGTVCVVCEVVTSAALHPLQGAPGNAVAVAWVHSRCMADYGCTSTTTAVAP
jgi:hypothetical protein